MKFPLDRVDVVAQYHEMRRRCDSCRTLTPQRAAGIPHEIHGLLSLLFCGLWLLVWSMLCLMGKPRWTCERCGAVELDEVPNPEERRTGFITLGLFGVVLVVLLSLIYFAFFRSPPSPAIEPRPSVPTIPAPSVPKPPVAIPNPPTAVPAQPVAVDAKVPPKYIERLKNPARFDGIRVEIERVAVAKVPLDEGGQRVESEAELLAITVKVTNEDPQKTYEFHSWRGLTGLGYPIVRELNGPRMNRVRFPAGITIRGAIPDARLAPGQSLTDVLVFDKPHQNAKTLEIELSGLALANKGVFHRGLFRFHVALNDPSQTPAVPTPEPTPTPAPMPEVIIARAESKPGAGSESRSKPPPPQILRIVPSPLPVPLAISPQALTEYITANSLDNRKTTQMLIDSKQIFLTKVPVEVRVETKVQDRSIIRIADGPLAGKIFVVESRHLR